MELFDACRKSNLAKVKEFLPKIHYRNVIVQCSRYGDTPLHIACSLRDLEIVKEILKYLDATGLYRGLIIQDCNGNTPLHIACRHSQLDIVKELLPRLKNEDLMIQNNNGEIPLYDVYRYGDLKIARELLKYYKIKNLRDICIFGQKPLHYICRKGDLEMAKEFLKYLEPVDLNIKKYNSTPLYEAIRWGRNLELIKVLILHGSLIGDDFNYIYIDGVMGGDYMDAVKWSRSEHKNIMHIQTRQNMQLVFMMYKKYDMLEKL